MLYYWWLVIGLLLMAAEVIIPGFVIFWFGVGAIVTGICAFLGVETVILQTMIFAIVSILLVSISRKFFINMIKSSPGSEIKMNMHALMGKVGIVTEAIDNTIGKGRVVVESQDWMARSSDASIIEQGSKIKILRTEGATLIVEEINN